MTRLLATLGLGVILCGCDSSSARPFLPVGPTPPPPVVSQPPAPPPNYGQDPIIGAGTPVAVGETVQASVAPDDPLCFPFWDLTGQCRQYDLTVPQDGRLDVRLVWSNRRSEMTVFVVHDSFGWQSSDGPDTSRDRTEAGLSLPVVAGRTYHLLVMSYFPPQDFEMTTTLGAE